MFDFGIGKHEERKKDLEAFRKCAQDAMESCGAASNSRVQEFLAFKSKVGS